MFKSIYSKYIMSFVALLGLGFVAVAVVMTSLITNYSIDTKENLMFQTAKIVYSNVSGIMKRPDVSFSEAVDENREAFDDIFEPLSSYADSAIILTDGDGRILRISGDYKSDINPENESETITEGINGSVSRLHRLYLLS